MKKFVWLMLLAAVSYTACTHTRKPKPLGINRMKGIVWDLIKAGEWELQTIAKDTTAKRKKNDIRLYQQVFAIHGVSKDQFYSSYTYYEAHPVEFKILIDSVDALSTREKNQIPDKHGQAH